MTIRLIVRMIFVFIILLFPMLSYSLDDPLLLDLSGNGIFLGGQTRTAMLGGVLRMVRWTAAKTDDAFLVVDASAVRNASYSITDPSGIKIDGIILLRDGLQVKTPDGRIVNITDSWQFVGILDANRDGRLDAKDPAFQYCFLWNDIDANGAVGAGEVTALRDRGVLSIGVQGRAYAQDQYGNRRSDGTYLAAQGSRLASSVFLITVQP